VTIPANLRAYAGLDRDLTVIGVGDRVEIWDTAVWESYLTEQESSFANVTEEVIPGIF
jgi:MraZ protein